MEEAAGFHRERVPGGSGRPPSLGLVKSHRRSVYVLSQDVIRTQAARRFRHRSPGPAARRRARLSLLASLPLIC